VTDALTTAMAWTELPFAKPFITAKGTYHERRVLFVRLSAGGVHGYGEASPLPGFSVETFEDAKDTLTRCVDALEGRPCPGEHEEVSALLAGLEEQNAKLVPSARFALECALLDLIAKRRGESISQMLAPGGQRRDIAVNATIGADSPAACFSNAMEAFERGFSCFKLKVGGRPFQDDLARVRAVREAIGDAATLRLDANGAWQRQEAIDNLSKLRHLDISLIEQPVAAHDIEGLAMVRAASRVRIAADESIRSASDLEELFEHDAVDVIVLKPMMLGGLLPTLQLQKRALERGITTILTTSLEAAIGRTATLHLATACEGLEGPCGLATGALLARDVPPSPPEVQRGFLSLPTQHGLGLEPTVAFTQNTQQFTTSVQIPHPLLQRARYSPEHTALSSASGDAWSYAQLAEQARRAAGALLYKHHVKPGDRVGVLATNQPRLAALIHGISLVGATAVLFHPQQSKAEITSKSQVADLSLMVTSRGLEDLVDTRPTIDLEVMFDGSPAREDDLQHRISLDALHSFVFTSGTTGRSKMVALSWQNLIFSATGSAIQLGHLPTDRWLAAMPLCHVAGLSIVMRCAILGTTMVLHDKFDAKACADAIVSGEATMISVVARMLSEILKAMDGRAPSPDFRLALVGGGPIPGDLLAASTRAGITCSPTYGMSEGASQLTTRPPSAPLHAASAGWPLVWTEMRLANDSGAHHPEGEVEVRGPTLSPGYMTFDDGRAKLETNLNEQGWFPTGDWGSVLEDRSLELLDRRTDRIVSGGENISPATVERVLRALPAISDACVVGLPDDDWGHRVAAVVTLEPEANVTEAQMIAHCREHLATFEVPTRVHVWESLPRSSLMKVSRHRVRQMLSSTTEDEKERDRQ